MKPLHSGNKAADIYKAVHVKYVDGFFMVSNDHLNAKNNEDDIKPDEEAPLQRNIGPATDEEAYVTDKEAVQRRKIEPQYDMDGPPLRKNRPETDEEAPLQ